MTENRSDRAEQALRDALETRAAAFEPMELRPHQGRRRWWVPAIATAAVVAVVGVGSAVLGGGDDAGDAPTASRTRLDATDPPDGLRTVGLGAVLVDVPATWGDDYAPGSDWCADTGDGEARWPTEPYVGMPGNGATAAILCTESEAPHPPGFPDAPSRLWAAHLSFELPQDGADDGTSTYGDWTLTRRTVGDVVVSLLTDTSTADQIAPIMGSVRESEVDASGCATTSPIQSHTEFARPEPGFDVTTVDDVDSIVVCHYAIYLTDAPGLLASRVLEGESADDVLAALQAAPEGTGPDRPSQCMPGMTGDDAIALSLVRDDEVLGQVYVFYSWCTGNGFDDGTTHRKLTREGCEPLWGDRVVISGGLPQAMGLCAPARR